MSETLVVTGANGFVGRVVSEEAAFRGCAVRPVVRDARHVAALPGDVTVVPDLLRAADHRTLFSGADAVIHLAARVHVMKETASDPLTEFRLVNVQVTEAIARAAAAHGTKRFVYVSSIKVNGEETSGRGFRPDDPAAPQDAYGISKWEAERALKRIATDTGLEVTIIRPPLVYGPRVGGNFLRLLKLVARRVPLPFGGIPNHRSMIYNRNLAHALLACALHPKAAGKTFLVSDGEDLSIGELIRRMANALGTTARLLPVPPAIIDFAGRFTGMSGEIRRLTSSLTVDDTLTRAELEWAPPFAVDDGLAETARWFMALR